MSNQEQNRNSEGMTSAESMFIQLVLSFHAAAWQHMGKVASIVSGKVERNLEMAKHSIDMLAMLEEKTKGNLSEDEDKYVKHVLYELRMNYVEEAKKGDDVGSEEKKDINQEDENKKE